MTPIVSVVFTLSVLVLFWVCVALVVGYHRRVLREDPRYVRICPGDSRSGVGQLDAFDTSAPLLFLPEESPLVMSIYDPISLFELECVCAFERGFASEDHWNALDYCMRVLRFGTALSIESAMTLQRDSAGLNSLLGLLNVATLAGKALSRIRENFCTSGEFSASPGELLALKKLVTTSADFWPKQFRETYRAARQRADQDTYRAITFRNEGRVSV